MPLHFSPQIKASANPGFSATISLFFYFFFYYVKKNVNVKNNIFLMCKKKLTCFGEM